MWMHELDDIALLREFAGRGSEAAFAALVTRHVNKVYSVALRHTRNPHQAEEITQAVFVILARKAGQLGKKVILSGWLYQTARLTAVTLIRSEIRRARREQEVLMQNLSDETEADPWPHIAPLLDDAMVGLSETDRHAVVLRYFDGKSLKEVGAALGGSEDAAKMRVNRAVEKLRKFFAKRGVALTATVIAGAVATNSVQAAPVGLAVTISATAAKGAAVAATITTLVKGTLKIMTYAKLKLAIGITAGILLAGGATTMVISQTSTDDKWTPQKIAKQSQDAYAVLTSYCDSGITVVEGGGENSKNIFTTRLARPNLYRIEWTQTSGSKSSKGVVWSEGKGDFMVQGQADQAANAKPQKMNDAKQALSISAAVSGRGTSGIPETFLNKDWDDALVVVALGRSELKKEKDETIGNVDCHVISSIINTSKMRAEGKLPEGMGEMGTATSTTLFWIGKKDHLIHQTQTSVDTASVVLQMSDAAIKNMLEKQNKPATPEAIAAWRTQMDAMMKQVQGAKYVFTETHENIVVNQKFSPADFTR